MALNLEVPLALENAIVLDLMTRSGTHIFKNVQFQKTYIFSKYYTPSPEGRRTRTAQGRTKNDKKKIVIIDPVERCYRPRVSEYDKALIRTYP